jgi:TonB family protein
MKALASLLSLILACSAVAAVPKGGPRYESDSGTVNFLRRHLVSGSDIHYPLEAAKAKQWGSGFYLMKLADDGSVQSLTTKRWKGDRVLDEHARRTLQAYRFKPKTKGPLLWLVSFDPPARVIIKAMLVKDEKNIDIPPF